LLAGRGAPFAKVFFPGNIDSARGGQFVPTIEVKMGARQQKMEMLRKLLQGATIKIVRDPGHFVQISYRDTTVHIPPGLAHELQRTLFAIRDLHMEVNIEDYLRLGLPSTLQQCREFQRRRKAANRAAHAAREAGRRDKRRLETEERDLISEFFSDLTIQWEFVGFEEWTATARGPDESKVQRTTPRFRYSLEWGEESMSFVLSFQLGQGESGGAIRRLETIDIQGDEPSWDWRKHLDIKSLYYETEDEYLSGRKNGEIIPTWLNMSKLITGLP
jgi:hypothetical protein